MNGHHQSEEVDIPDPFSSCQSQEMVEIHDIEEIDTLRKVCQVK